MKKYTQLIPNRDLVLALGYFDGIHLGHQAVIKSAVEYAHKNSLKSAIITFKEHPFCYLNHITPKYITTDREKLISELGIDYFYELEFDDTIAKLSAEEYLRDILVKHFTPKAIFTGFNHTFGMNKQGNANFLRNNQSKYNYEYYEIEPKTINNTIISSTTIRNYLMNGDIEKANQMLGKNFSVKGEIIEGQKLGRKFGYKTANIVYPKELIEIPYGVYQVNTNYGTGIANFGIRPTVNNTNTAVLETHILNFDKDIYGEILNIEFTKMLRPEQKFTSTNELIEQIKTDISKITHQN